jgi:hypothetical protein
MTIKDLKQKFPRRYLSDVINISELPANFAIKGLYNVESDLKSFRVYLDSEDDNLEFKIYEKSLSTLSDISAIINELEIQFQQYKNPPVMVVRQEIGNFINNITSQIMRMLNSTSELDFKNVLQSKRENINTVFSVIQSAITDSKIKNQESRISAVQEQATLLSDVVSLPEETVELKRNTEIITELDTRIFMYSWFAGGSLFLFILIIILVICLQNGFTDNLLDICKKYDNCDKDVFILLKSISLVPTYFLVTLLAVAFKSFETQRRKFEKRKLIYTVMIDAKTQISELTARESLSAEFLKHLIAEDDFSFEQKNK